MKQSIICQNPSGSYGSVIVIFLDFLFKIGYNQSKEFNTCITGG